MLDPINIEDAGGRDFFERKLIVPDVQPNPDDYEFELEQALSSVVGITSIVSADAHTAEVLGTERAGYGVLIRSEGVVLTIGYLIAEAETIWIKLSDGRAVQGHVLAYDHETGFGLLQALARLDMPALTFGQSSEAKVGDRVVVAGSGGRKNAVAAQIVAKQEFAGYWEYLLDDAIFTAPSHPNWGGTALISAKGDLLGIGSLHLQQTQDDAHAADVNMVVPIDILKPVLNDLLTLGRPSHKPRPWLGIYTTEIGNRIIIAAIASHGPAQKADLAVGDIVMGTGNNETNDLATLYRQIWSMGDAGVEVPLLVHRDGRTFEVRVRSGDRNEFLKSPMLH